MKTKRIHITALIMLYGCFLFSQNISNQTGGRALAVSGSSATYKDLWSQYHNQAALAYLKGINVGVAYKNAFLIKELSTNSVAFAFPIKSGVFGFNYYYFGYTKYNENKLGFSFAKKLGKRFALGGQIDYFYTQIQGEYGQAGLPAGELGILSEPIENLYIGAHVFNIWNSKYQSEETLYLPTIFNLGASYLLYKKAMLSIEIEKDLDLSPVFKTGLEMELLSRFYFRAGIASNPTSYSFGLGYTYYSVQLNMAFIRHPVLGYSTGISISYAFKDRI